MRFSQLFINTLKDAPKDAVLKVHKSVIAGWIYPASWQWDL